MNKAKLAWEALPVDFRADFSWEELDPREQDGWHRAINATLPPGLHEKAEAAHKAFWDAMEVPAARDEWANMNDRDRAAWLAVAEVLSR